MKRFQLSLFIPGILCALIWLGCGGDDADVDDDNDDNNAGTTVEDGGSSDDNVDIVGTWKLVSFEPQVAEPLPQQTLTIKSDGTWSAITVSEVPVLGKFTVTAKGTYKVSGNQITGTTSDIKTEPNLGVPIPVTAGLTGESTFKLDGNKLIVTSKDQTTGQTSTTVYQKQ